MQVYEELLMDIPVAIRARLCQLLESLPTVQTLSGRRALLYRAGLDDLASTVNFDGNAKTFVSLLVRDLATYGRLDDGREPLTAILTTVKRDVGTDRRDEIDRLIREYQAATEPGAIRLTELVPKCQEVLDLIESREYRQLTDAVYNWVRSDQIPETGGWGKGWVQALEYISGRKLTPFEKIEGGIISTFVVLRALYHYEPSPSTFLLQPYIKAAKRYLLERQTRVGSFGRLVQSRSGVEIHPSLRHTAFAVASLIDMEARPTPIIRGMEHLCTWSVPKIEDDAAPSIAIAAIIHTTDKFLSRQDLLRIIKPEEELALNLREWSTRKQLLFRKLVDLVHDTHERFAPFWQPYGSYERDLFYTPLTTIDLLAAEFPPSLEPKLARMFSVIMAHEIQGGIPYEPRASSPDVGFTAYVASVVLRPEFLRQLRNVQFARTLVKAGLRYLEFVLTHYDKTKEFMRLTYCDTLPNILLLKGLQGD